MRLALSDWKRQASYRVYAERVIILQSLSFIICYVFIRVFSFVQSHNSVSQLGTIIIQNMCSTFLVHPLRPWFIWPWLTCTVELRSNSFTVDLRKRDSDLWNVLDLVILGFSFKWHIYVFLRSSWMRRWLLWKPALCRHFSKRRESRRVGFWKP